MEQLIRTIQPLHHLVSSAPLIRDSSAIKYNLVLIKTCSIALRCHCLELQQAPDHTWGKAQRPLAALLPSDLGGMRAEKNEVTIAGGCRDADQMGHWVSAEESAVLGALHVCTVSRGN